MTIYRKEPIPAFPAIHLQPPSQLIFVLNRIDESLRISPRQRFPPQTVLKLGLHQGSQPESCVIELGMPQSARHATKRWAGGAGLDVTTPKGIIRLRALAETGWKSAALPRTKHAILASGKVSGTGDTLGDTRDSNDEGPYMELESPPTLNRRRDGEGEMDMYS